MNVYDFDKTIFYPDSSYTFGFYFIRKHPEVLADSIMNLASGVIQAFKCGDLSIAKEAAFTMISYLPDIDSFVDQFWKDNSFRISEWYLNQKRPDDVIVSAGPEFLLKPVAEKLGVHLIATPMDKYSGYITGVNNSGAEKVRRFKKEFPDAVIDEFYSDSFKDAPMARIAKKDLSG